MRETKWLILCQGYDLLAAVIGTSRAFALPIGTLCHPALAENCSTFTQIKHNKLRCTATATYKDPQHLARSRSQRQHCVVCWLSRLITILIDVLQTKVFYILWFYLSFRLCNAEWFRFVVSWTINTCVLML